MLCYAMLCYVNTTVEEVVLSVGPRRDYISSAEQNQMRMRIEGVQWRSSE
jgi:hypothetical protein